MPKLSATELKAKLKEIKLLALDVDGVLTDDSIYIGPDNFELKKFNISDGLFMVLAMRAGLEIAIVSSRYSKATESRMKDLGVKHVLQEYKEKVQMVKPLLQKLDLGYNQIAFVGNEIMDVSLVKKAGLGIAVADSARELIDNADFVTSKSGGNGAVREVLEYYFEAVEKDPKEFLQ